MLLYSSDYPHEHGSNPNMLFSVLSAEQAERVRWRNAWDTYGLEGRLQSLSDAAAESK